MKIPLRGSHGHLDATTDEDAIYEAWRLLPMANPAIATGPARLVVVDLDPRHGGFDTWRRLDQEHGPISQDTPTVHTPRGGIHLYYAAPEGADIRGSAGTLGPGIDLRAHGGYVVVPPSVVRGVGSYGWDEGRWYDGEPAPLPRALWALIQQSQVPRAGGAPRVGEVISEGERHATFVSLAGTMRRRGMTSEEIAAALHVVNARRCMPPLEDREIEQIAASMAGYAPAEELTVRQAPRIRRVVRHA
jgi:putative DNA primase/helicase